MMDFIRAHQSNVMLMISSVMCIVFIFTLNLRFSNRKAKMSLIAMEISAFVMIVMDRYAYIFRGNETTLGYWMVRISNFLVFLMILAELASYIRYTMAVIMDIRKGTLIPRILFYSQFIIIIGVILLVISQFTGLYYTFDATNHYVRSAFFPVCYIIPVIIFIILVATEIKAYSYLNPRLRIALLLFPTVVFTGSVIQLFVYGISLNTLSFCVMTLVIFMASLRDLNATVEEARIREISVLQDQNENIQELFTQTVEALASAIDAKDQYTHGHSTRVAEYSVRLARMAGKDDQECERIYFSGILHDVGKIGIPDNIINKTGKLSDDEYAIIKSHPVMGGQILSRITKRPYLSIGAKYHNERYDGKGYPEHLKGEDIPEMARIIAVADAYDAMTSRRSYREPIPQQKVREEIIKGTGTQFDPTYAKLMIELIDSDIAYDMKEKGAVDQLDGKSELICGGYRENFTKGFRIMDHFTTIKFNCVPQNDGINVTDTLSIIAFDSLNERVYQNDVDKAATEYYEYGEIGMNGKVTATGVRKMRREKIPRKDKLGQYQFCVEAVRYRDHMLARIDNGSERYEIIFALPDSSRFLYFALTGEQCTISTIDVNIEETPIDAAYIPRIAPKIVYLNIPDGDVPNVEIDNYKTNCSRTIPIAGGVKFDFNYKSLPYSTRIWHCPIIVIFSSEDGSLNGADYREFGNIRFDGESWGEDAGTTNSMTMLKTDAFCGWDGWKENNKKGVRSVVSIVRENNRVVLKTENGGINIVNVTEIADMPSKLYAGITGDQCTIAGIKITY